MLSLTTHCFVVARTVRAQSKTDQTGSLSAPGLAPADTSPSAAPTSQDNENAELSAPQSFVGESPFDAASQSVWESVPITIPTPRIGWFAIPPSGPGFYSAADVLFDRSRESAPPRPFPPTSANPLPFFDANYKYLDDSPVSRRAFFDRLKRRHPGSNWMGSFGGEERVRSMREPDCRLTEVNNDFVLTRSRLYADFWYRDEFRVYAEMQNSESTAQTVPPLRTDIDPADLLNLFADVKAADANGAPLYVRGGRQELNYGSQRLISSSDFANTRRTFSGVKGFWHGEKLSLDAFWVQPVEILANQFDHPDPRQQFVGVWGNYRPRAGQQIDLYYLLLDNTNQTFAGRANAIGGYAVDTFGARYAGDSGNVLWDFEGMLQCGEWVNQRIAADAYAAGLGYRFAGLSCDPHWWVYYEGASGDQTPGSGPTHGTFNQLFAWGHAYFGYLDLVGRQNIRDLNTQFSLFPAPWITLVTQFHCFRLDSARDALYDATGTAIRQDRSGAAGVDVGDEIDLTVNFHLADRHEFFVGYSKLFAGSFIRETGPAVSPELTYISYSFKW
jgi:hypothetical protein